MAKEIKPTGGAWVASPDAVCKGTSIVSLLDNGSRVHIAQCDFTAYRAAQRLTGEPIKEFNCTSAAEESNAKLMAAAPEMLDALITFIKRVQPQNVRGDKVGIYNTGDLDESIIKALKALDKAKIKY